MRAIARGAARRLATSPRIRGMGGGTDARNPPRLTLLRIRSAAGTTSLPSASEQPNMTSLRDSFLNCVANLPTGQTTKREAFLERQCAELAQQNEELRRKLRLLSTSTRGYPPLAASSGPSFSLTSLRAEGPVERKVSDTLTTNPGSRTDLAGLQLEEAETCPERGGVERSELAAIAVAAAAREEAYYHGSLVHVLIDNDTYTDRTKVTVRAPEHERLLANEPRRPLLPSAGRTSSPRSASATRRPRRRRRRGVLRRPNGRG